ncbi:MAG: signal recognition particle receptor subunit alpha, partial [Opitutales bacterium]|nr:signal recognition particle receptor subunit alpha [Opitutales bacterium]
MRGLFKKFKDGLKRQTPTFRKAFDGIFSGAQLDAGALDELEEALYTADFGHETVEEIIDEIKVAYKADKTMRGEDAAKIGATVLARVLEGAEG